MYLFTINIPNSLLFLICVIFLIYKWSVARYDHFAKRNVAHDKPTAFFGSFKEFFLLTNSYFGIMSKLYEKYKDKGYFGMYLFRYPILMVTEPALIRRITVTDFDHFANHSSYLIDSSLLELTMTMMKDENWRDMREALAPVFSVKNVQNMFYLIKECSDSVMGTLRERLGSNETIEVDLKDFLKRFVVDVVASTTFGIKPNSLGSKNNVFYTKLTQAVQVTPTLYLKVFFYGNFPKLMRFFGVSFLDKDFLKYFQTLVKEMITFRKANNIEHFDIVQLLIEKTKDCNIHNEKFSSSISEDHIIAQCLLIMFDGFTKTAHLAHCLTLELAANPDVQNKLIMEIDQVLGAMKNKAISYSALMSLNYLDMVILETLRKWSSEHDIDRMCTKPCRFYDNSGEHWIDMKPGDQVGIPLLAIHNDPVYFPEPEKFQPERFCENRRGFIKPYTYLPFGTGPRNCLGSKFALIQIKAAVFSLLSEFRIEPKSKKQSGLKINKKGYFIEPTKFEVQLRRRSIVENKS